VVFAANGASAQQSAQATQAPTSAGQPAAPATANPAPTGKSVPTSAPNSSVNSTAGATASKLAAAGAASASQNEASNQGGAPKNDGSLRQGLQVHGHWVINIRNPDGTLVEHREFENSLQPTGAGMLVGLLSGYMVPGDWMIAMNGGLTGITPCPIQCALVHNEGTQPALFYCLPPNGYYCTGSTLTYTFNLGNLSTGAGSPSIVLNGTITAPNVGSIGTVNTVLSTCANIPNVLPNSPSPTTIETNSPASCPAAENQFNPLFTSANLTPAIPVNSGQQIQVIVTITFS
jgi:hypothetical protein